jgi:predicted Zn-dependent peptidase
MQTSITKLENGLFVAIWPFPALESVGIAVGVRYGSVDENPEINGSAHFLEHMLFKGTKNRTWKNIEEEIREIGAYINAGTDYESTIYMIRSHNTYFDKALDILSDMIKNSTLPEKEFELERGPIINENLIYADNPLFFARDYLPRILFKKHPAKMPIGGNNKTIKKISRDDLLEIYRKYYTPKNTAVVIYGGIKKEDALSKVSKYFSDFEGEYTPITTPIANEEQVRREKIFERIGTKQARIAIGFKCSEFRRGFNDLIEELALDVVNDWLSYTLFEEVREKRGLAYDVGSDHYSYSTFGFIAAEAGIEPKNIHITKEVILKQFEKLQKGELSKEEVDKIKNKLSIKNRMQRENTLTMANSIAFSQIVYGDATLVETFPEEITKVTLDDVRKVCNKYIDVDRYGMVVLKPKIKK